LKIEIVFVVNVEVDVIIRISLGSSVFIFLVMLC